MEDSLGAFNASDWERLVSFWADDVEAVGPKDWPESGLYRGKESTLGQFKRLQDSWSSSEVEAVSHETKGDVTCTRLRWRVRGSASGLESDLDMWMLAEFEGELYSRIWYFMDEAEAREAFRRAAS